MEPIRPTADEILKLLDEMLNYSSAMEPVQIFVEDGGVILEPPIEYAKAKDISEVFVGESLQDALSEAVIKSAMQRYEEAKRRFIIESNANDGCSPEWYKAKHELADAKTALQRFQ